MKSIYCVVAIFCLLLASLTAGCGGSSSSSTQTPSVTLKWGQRTRDISGPASALSAVILFKAQSAGESDVAFTVNRNPAPAAYSQSYTSPSKVSAGSHILQVTFDAQANGQGGAVAIANVAVTVLANGSIENSDGFPDGTISAVSSLSSVFVIPNQLCVVGQTMTVLVSALDATGNVVAISPGGTSIQITSGSQNGSLTSTGDLQGLTLGIVNVIATVDGIVSPAQSITVVSSITSPSVRMLPISANALISDPITGRLWASMPSTSSVDPNSVVEIDPASGSILNSVPVGSEPSAMDISDDGSKLYVGLNGVSTIQTVDPVGMVAGGQFPVPPGNFQNPIARDIKVAPGNPNLVAVTRSYTQYSGNDGPALINSGVALPSQLGQYQGDNLVFFGSGTLYAYTRLQEPASLLRCLVSATGVSIEANLTGSLPSVDNTIVASGANLYAADGTILAGASGSVLGRFAVTNGYGVAIDSANGVAFFIEANLTTNPNEVTVVAFNLSTKAPIASQSYGVGSISSSPEVGPLNLVRWGAKGLAFRSTNDINFIDAAPGLQ